MAERKHKHTDAKPENRTSPVKYVGAGHPSIQELMAQQGTGPITDVSVLHGDFWPEEESIEEFLEALHEWRGHRKRT